MSATSRPEGLYETISGPSSIEEATEQLAAGAEQLAADAARPTKPGSDGHANDPSKTTTTQRKYAQKLRGRFSDINTEIRRGVRDRDVFDLSGGDEEQLAGEYHEQLEPIREKAYELLADERYDDARKLFSSSVEQLADFDAADLVGRDYQFQTDADKHEEFMGWLRQQEENGPLEAIGRNENTYVNTAYERGAKNADAWTEYDHHIPVETSLDLPVHEDKLQLLYERNYEALQGITDDVARDVSRELADGLSEGVSPDEMARRMTDRVDKIGKTRATTLARTEVMNAHHEGTLTRYEEFMAEDAEVQILTEISTSNDDHVCDQCDPWEGETMTISEARSDGPPFHPRCRCVLIAAPESSNGGSGAPAAS